MGYQDELWFQNLEEWIFDESKLVTYKYVAASLKIHVNAAKKMLYTFNKESSRKTFAIYLVVGSINEECHIRLIADKGIEKEEAKFDKVLSKHVYALGQPSIYDENDLSGMLHLGFTINSPDEILPYRGVLCNKSQKVREMDSSLELPQNEMKKEEAGTIVEETKMKVEESTDKKPVVKDVATKAAKKPTVGAGKSDAIKSMFAKVKVEEPTDKKPVVKDVATKAVKKPTVGAGKSDAIKSMFAKAPPKKEKVPEEKSEKSDSPGKENKASQESSSTTNKPDTKSQKVNGKTTSNKRRKRIQMMSDSDSSDNEETEPNNDYHEPSPIKDEPCEEMDTLPASPEPVATKSSKGSHRTRKMINKTFVDESGFLVTKKELVSCSEEDEPEPSPPKKALTDDPPKAVSTAISSPSKVNKKQSSIRNFFTKK